jgi:hypothetical protein
MDANVVYLPGTIGKVVPLGDKVVASGSLRLFMELILPKKRKLCEIL